MQIILRFFIFTVILNFCTISFANSNRVIRIAAGSLLEGYYNIGITLCRYIENSNDNVKCDVVPSSGSLENIELLRDKKVDFAISLSNLTLDSYNGEGYFKDNKSKDLLQILNLYDKSFLIITKDDDNLRKFSDIGGKNISNGPPMSDSTIIFNELMKFYDFEKQPHDIEISHEYYAKEYCAGKIDVLMFMSGHPNSLVNLITHSCESDFTGIDEEKIDLIVKNNPVFKKVIIKKGIYPGITRDEYSIAISSIFITRKDVDSNIVKNFIKYFKFNINNFKNSEPVLFDLDNNHFMSDFVLPSFFNE